MSQLDIVIVNWNAGDQLKGCLESIVRSTSIGLLGQVVVVDNASSDGSAENLEAIPLPLATIRNDSNRGFAAACNQGAAICRSKYVLFLNPDTIVEMASLTTPLHFMEMEENADVGVCGIQLRDESEVVSRSCSRAPNARLLIQETMGLSKIAPRWFHGMPMAEWSHDQTRDVDQVIGAFFFVRRHWFTQLRGFDQRFFVYFEEVDFCKRVIDRGQRVVYLTSAQAFHRGGGTSDQVKAHRLFYSRRSRIQYSFKHFSVLQALAVTAATLLLEPALMISRGVIHRSAREIGEALYGFRMLWTDLPKFLRPHQDTPIVESVNLPDSSLTKAA